jgi:pimeloyl-ACP methyl ester carboxylesterase
LTDDCRPPLQKLLAEAAALPRLFISQWRKPIIAEPMGEPRPVLVIPGFLANDVSTSLLRRTLSAAGCSAYGWHMGVNLGVRPETLERLGARLDTIIAEAGGPVALVGWSLGGLYARELAKRRTEDVDLVITLGTPFSGDLHANNAWRIYERINDHKVDSPPVEVDLPVKPAVRTVALWSPRDGIVAPACTRGVEGEADERIELRCTHMGFAIDAEPLRTIVNLLRR